MKRVVLFLSIILFIGFSISAEQMISFSPDEAAVLPVSWDLKSIAGWYNHNIDILDSNKAEPLVGKTLDLTTDTSVAGMITGKATAFLEWNIDAPVPVTISFQSSGAMTRVSGGSQSTDLIHWIVSWSKEDEENEVTGSAEIKTDSLGGSVDAYGTREAVVHSGSLKNRTSSGFCKLDISTLNAYSAAGATYEATLTLIIEGV